MSRIYNFSSFIDFLNEIRFTEHWRDRTASPGSRESIKLSRIVPYRENEDDSGFVIEGVLDPAGNLRPLRDVVRPAGILESEISSLITYTLKAMTRSNRLQDWNSDTGKEYLSLYLGRICLYLGPTEKYYVVLKAGVSKKAKKEMIEKGKEPFDFYDPGDAIYGYVKEKYNGTTIKFYPSTDQGRRLSYTDFKGDSKLSDSDFFSKHALEFPYGKNFEILVDLSDPSNGGRMAKIQDQLRGEEITLGPAETPEYVPEDTEEPMRKTIAPGDAIGLVVKYIDPENPIMGRVISIMNMDDIKAAQKFKAMGEIVEIKVAFIPDAPHAKTGSNGLPLQIPVRIISGSKIIIGGAMYGVLGKGGDKPLVTSEPSILEKDSVQTWVKRIQ
jgi:hypothetical protein